MFYRRRRPFRPPDCAGPGIWFLTINAFESRQLFGSVSDCVAHLNAIGTLVKECWQQVPGHFPHARLDDFVVMPNHLHPILELTGAIAEDDERRERFGAPVHGSVATIVRSFKAAVTREARSMLGAPVVLWQKGYHALRIADRNGLERARRYIRLNPERWTERHPRSRDSGKETRFVTFPLACANGRATGPTR